MPIYVSPTDYEIVVTEGRILRLTVDDIAEAQRFVEELCTLRHASATGVVIEFDGGGRIEFMKPIPEPEQ